jgi:hypothetical protein
MAGQIGEDPVSALALKLGDGFLNTGKIRKRHDFFDSIPAKRGPYNQGYFGTFQENSAV